jgi:hypothetical protein
MTAPRRWLEDPEADPTVRAVLQGAPTTHPLDAVTRRRLGAKVARASALPVVAAGWLFVKSATAALGVVLGTGAIAVSAGIVDWGPPKTPAPSASPAPPVRSENPARARGVPSTTPEPQVALPIEAAVPPAAQLNPTPTLPVDSSGSNRLSEEATLLEAARTQLRVAPAEALAISRRHAARFPRGQLASERALIQIDALHRLGRDPEARAVARQLLGTAGAGLYAERVRQLLGDETKR